MTPKHQIMMHMNLNLRFWLALILCLPITVLHTGNAYFDLNSYVNAHTTNIIQLIISAIVVFGCGGFFFTRALKSIMTMHLNMFTLIALAVGADWFYSLFAMFMPESFPPEFRLADGSVPVYFDAACYVTMLVLLGQMLEMRSRMKVNRDIAKNLKSGFGARFSVAQINDLKQKIMDAHKSEVPLEKLINGFAQFFIVLVLITALMAFTIWYYKGPAPQAVNGLIIAVSVLLAACPCALTLAAPISIMIGLNKAAEKGILINNPDVIEEIYHHQDIAKLWQEKRLEVINLQNLNSLSKADILMPNNNQNTNQELQNYANDIMKNIKQNLILGLGYNIIMIPIAAGILYPYWGILLGPVGASIAMSVSSIAVVLNALRLRKQLK